ncbi:MAG: YraN family protein [Tannerellaceae bacterium]|nr:YraN family protein [Tannerellaceae bacterium]
MSKQNITGKVGEEEARKYLIEHGYEILHSNWRWRHYEIDIVAANDNELVIIEVKTRTAGCLLSPEEAVTRTKIRRVVEAANEYIRSFDLEKAIRFDIISVLKKGEYYEIEHIEDAFHAPLSWKR